MCAIAKSHSIDVVNHVTKTHATSSELTFDAGMLLGEVGFSTTTTNSDKEDGFLHSYSNTGVELGTEKEIFEIGAGINIFNKCGVDIGLSSELHVFADVQATSWLHASASVGFDGVGFSVGVNDKFNSYDFNVRGGWGLAFLLLLAPKNAEEERGPIPALP